MIDLHLHSNASDGVISPAQVARNASDVGLTLFALTDHDTTAGLEEAAEEAKRLGVPFVPGVEMTSSLGEDEIHVLGYHIDPAHETFRRACDEALQGLRDRLGEVIERLRPMGFSTTLEEVDERAGKPSFLGRPHLARLMVERGFVADFKEAFERHLGQEGDTFVPLHGRSVESVIGVIRAAGGLAVLAHPRYFNYPVGAHAEDVAPLVEAGLGGIEVYHASHAPEEIQRFEAISDRFDLVVTGGTDCHGVRLPDGSLGIEHPCVPEGVGERFLRHCEGLSGRRQ